MATNGLSKRLLDRLILLGWIQRRFRVPYVLWGVMIFSGYYLLPLVTCAIEGVLIRRPAALQKGIQLPGVVEFVGRHDVPSPYLKDLTHLLLAVLVSLGGTVCIIALARFMNVYQSVSDPELLLADTQAIQLETQRMERRLGNRIIILLIAAIAASCGMALYYDGSLDQRWWGNPEYGPAGAMLAIGVSFAIFYGMHALYLLAVAQYSVGRLVSTGVHLRPFHPDGCNGFGKLGNLLLLLLLFCFLCATSAWITVRHGYLGIEEFPGIWLADVVIVVFIPFIVIQPLAYVSTEVRRAQLLRLAPVEQLLNVHLKANEDRFGDPAASDTRCCEMKTLRELHQVAKDIYETSVFPFNRKVASVLSVGYVVQAAALAKEIIGKFR